MPSRAHRLSAYLRLALFACMAIGGDGARAAAAAVSIDNVRLWPAPDHTRLVFDIGAPVTYKLSLLAEPHRLVIDLEDAKLLRALPAIDSSGPVVGGIRAAAHGSTVRVVVDLKTEIKPRSFTLQPYEQYGHRLVVDLFDAKVVNEQPELPLQPPKTATRDLLVAIDAGHGGEDPGAIGQKRTREKDVVLAIARELQRQINDTPGMRAFLVRDGDYYISLRERIDKARKQDPDVFISIHADAVPGRRRVQGASVYVLSERGATREAAYLAAKENAADLIGGVQLDNKDDILNRVLVDMTQAGTINSSFELGSDLLAALRRVGPVHAQTVGQAGFFVLRSPFIPSVLIETAFISNPDEERKLRDPGFRRKLAQGIVNGLRRAAPRLLARRPGVPAATPVVTEARGAQDHVVRSGETLDSIARQYNIHIDTLRFANNLPDHRVSVGERLRIPARGGDS